MGKYKWNWILVVVPLYIYLAPAGENNVDAVLDAALQEWDWVRKPYASLNILEEMHILQKTNIIFPGRMLEQ